MQFQIGDMVTRASYQMDIMFRIIRIDETDQHEATAILHGNEVRLIADAKMSDLVLIQKEEQLTRERRTMNGKLTNRSTYLGKIISCFVKNKSIIRLDNISIRSSIFICPERFCI